MPYITSNTTQKERKKSETYCARTMSSRRQNDIPESVLNDYDYEGRTRREFRPRATDPNYARTNQSTSRWGQNRLEGVSEEHSTFDRGPPSYLERTERKLFDTGPTPLTSLGKTKLVKWTPPQSSVYQSDQNEGGPRLQTIQEEQGKYGIEDRKHPPEDVRETNHITNPPSKRPDEDYVNIPSTDLTFDPYRERSEPHPQQLCPSGPLYSLAQTLYKRDPMTWTIDDLHTPQSSDGTSILVSALVDHASTVIAPGMSQAQSLSLSKIAVTTPPAELLECLQSNIKARNFIRNAEKTQPPPTLETLLHPAATPGLIHSETTRARMKDRDIIRSEMIDIITAFVRCYYPKQAASIIEHVRSISVQVLMDYIYKPGYLVTDLRNRGRQMTFSPPKWCRLSIHPDEKIQATPRRRITWQDIPISPFDVAENLQIDVNELLQQPFTAQRTAILAAIPLIFDNRSTREGCMETMSLVEEATSEEVYNFLLRSTQVDSAQPENPDAKEGIPQPEYVLYCIRFEHADRRRKGFWNEAPGAILLKWIQAVIPVITSNNISIILSQAPYQRVSNDRSLSPPFSATAEQLEEFIHNCTSTTKLSRFEVWMKSTCTDLEELMMTSRSGLHATTYVRGMKAAKIWMETISQTKDGIVPVLMLGGSIEMDPDDMIGAELNDRLQLARIDLEDCPHFHIAYCAVHTSTGKAAIMAKCIMAHKEVAPSLHHIFTVMVTPGMQARHLITRDYFFAPILYPPNDKSDRELSKAMTRQREFTESIIQTTILGLNEIDPYNDIPTKTRDFCTDAVRANSTTLAEIILLGKTLDISDYTITSPALKLTTNRSGNRLYITALKQDTENLIKFTKQISQTMAIWYPDKKMKPRCDFSEANKYMKNALSTQAESQTMTPLHIRDRWQSEELIVKQRQLENASTSDSLSTIAKDGIAATFLPATTPIENTSAPPAFNIDTHRTTEPINPLATSDGNVTASLPNVNQIETIAVSSNADVHGASDLAHVNHPKQLDPSIPELQKEILDLKSELKEIHSIVKSLGQANTHPAQIANDEIASTISTMVETNIQSSLTSTSKLISHCETQLTEQTKMLTDFLTNLSHQIQDIHSRVREGDEKMESFDRLVKRHDDVLKLTTMGMKDMQDRHTRLMSILEQQLQIDQSADNAATDLSRTKTDESSSEEENESPEKAQEISETEGAQIRQKAAEMLSYMATMPYRSKTGTWEDDADSSEDETPQLKPAQTPPVKSHTCEKCAEHSKSLIYCDKCPPSGDMKLYHPECLTFLPDEKLRVCEQCTPQPLNETEAEPSVLDASSMTTKDILTTPKPSRTSRSSDMEDSDQSDSLPSPASSESFPPPFSIKRSKQTPNYLARTTIPGSSLKDSPIKTRAARKAENLSTQESTTDTDDQTATSRE